MRHPLFYQIEKARLEMSKWSRSRVLNCRLQGTDKWLIKS